MSTAVDEINNDISAGNLSLREAIGIANGTFGGNTITFAPELSGVTILLKHGELAINEQLAIDASSLTSPVIIDAQQQSRVINFNDAENGDLTLAGLTITGGLTTDFAASGGGILFDSSNPLFAQSGSLTIVDSSIQGNQTTANGTEGGGVFIADGGNFTLANSEIINNSTIGFVADGGGISFGSGMLSISSSLIQGNSTTGGFTEGGGISTRTFAGVVSISDSTIDGNSSASAGGGLALLPKSSISGSTISNNSVAGNGGGFFQSASPSTGVLTISSSTFNANTAGISGGGIFANEGFFARQLDR